MDGPAYPGELTKEITDQRTSITDMATGHRVNGPEKRVKIRGKSVQAFRKESEILKGIDDKIIKYNKFSSSGNGFLSSKLIFQFFLLHFFQL